MILCNICGKGELRQVKLFRLSNFLAVTGYLVLALSVMSFAYAGYVVTNIGIATSDAVSVAKEEAREALIDEDIAEDIVDRVIKGKKIDSGVIDSLWYSQQLAIQKAQNNINETKAVAGFVSAVVGGLPVAALVASILGGILGGILTLKKSVLRCTECGAVRDAS